jgi:predicted N-acetyltransferase YhbS
MPSEELLGDGLILRPVRDERDMERYIALNDAVTGEGAICDRLLHHYPRTTFDDYSLVEDQRTGEVVSTTCLIPWRCRFEDVILETAMLEMVVTHPQYRHRGLARAQVQRFHRIVAERRFDLCIIQGIPFYYRQYGYAYALDHTPSELLPARQIPDRPADAATRFSARPVTPDDAATLAALYEQAMSPYSLAVQRSVEDWHYLLAWAGHAVRLVVDDRTGCSVGYVHVCRWPQEGELWVRESSIASAEAGMAVLRQLQAETAGEIRLTGSPLDELIRLGESLGSTPQPCGQWLFRFPDIARLIDKIGPVLERRLANSGCAGITADLCLNLYREAFALRFEAGKLCQVDSLGFVDASMGADGGDLCIPPEAFVRLVLGYRCLDELRDAWPDIKVKAKSRYLVEALFPRLSGCIWMPY